MTVRRRPVKTRGYAISGAAGGAVGAGVEVWAGTGISVAALARATCCRKVRRLVDITYRVLCGRYEWGGEEYCAEVPGANGQGKSGEECLAILREAISLILELNPTFDYHLTGLI